MRRRRWLQSVAALPALQGVVPNAAAQGPAAPTATSGSAEFPLLAETAPDAVADGQRRLLSAEQWEALGKLAAVLIPRMGERPGAADAGAVEFLDFLLKASGAERQSLYKNGLDRLNSEARQRYQKPFAALSAEQVKPILEPLRQAWSYAAPADGFARFLREAKDDLLQATVNSREFAKALSGRTRSAGGVNAYWLPLD